MSTIEMKFKIEELIELESLIEEAKNNAEEIRSIIKSEMEARGTEELEAGSYIVRWTSVLSTRFDTKRFKELFGDEIYNSFTTQVASRRFSISA